MRILLSYASEEGWLARRIAAALRLEGIDVRFDQEQLEIGDSIREWIDAEVASCDFAIVILSQHYFDNAKKWTHLEFNALLAREKRGQKLILPVWHNVTFEQVSDYSSIMADRAAGKTNQLSVRQIAAQVAKIAARRENAYYSLDAVKACEEATSARATTDRRQSSIIRSTVPACNICPRRRLTIARTPSNALTTDGFIFLRQICIDFAWGIAP